MLLILCLYLLLSLAATWTLFQYPYLKLSNLGWFVGIWTLPIIGAIFFFLTVIKNFSKGRSVHFQALRDSHPEFEKCDDDTIDCLGVDYDFLPYFRMKEYTVYENEEFIPAVLEAVGQAKKRIWFCTYIMKGDYQWQLLDLLEKAFQDGIDVRVLIDRVGSELTFWSKVKERDLKKYSFPLYVFRDSRIKSYLYIEKRLHSKIIVIDNDTGFIGSHNFRDATIPRHREFARNISIKFTGPVIHQLAAVYADLWFYNVKKDQQLTKIQKEICTSSFNNEGCHLNVGYPARIIFSEPLARNSIYMQYLTTLLVSAKQLIYIWMPYIIPTKSMRQILISKHYLGVEVKIIFPRKTDSYVVDNTHELVASEFVDEGVPCVRADGGFDHSKILIVDNIMLIGSGNLDYRSLYRNYEANVEVNDREFANEWQSRFNDEYSKYEIIKPFTLSHRKRLLAHGTSLIAGLY